MRRAAHLMARDANEPELVTLARQIGAHMERINEPVDWLCGFRGKWVPVEIKNPDGKNRYQEQQVRFLATARERQLPAWTWRTAEDVLASLGAVQTAGAALR
ncbi:MAG: hypothetical protein ACREUG_09060 [Steroidobacteraceae bacterium]